MDNRPIGVFDSGLGGLTAVKALRRILPGEDIVYFGDTGRIPYGTRSRETIVKYARQDMDFLNRFDVKMIVVACGTVSSMLNITPGFQSKIPFTGVLVPAAQAACGLSTSGRIGVIGTQATIRSGEFGRIIRSIRPDAQVFGNACSLLVPIVEAGLVTRDSVIATEAVAMYLAPLKETGVDTLVLGCTHFPLLYDIINEYLEYKVTLIDSGAEVARHVRNTLAAANQLSEKAAGGSFDFYVSDTVDGFAKTAQLFLGEPVSDQVSRVDLEAI